MNQCKARPEKPRAKCRPNARQESRWWLAGKLATMRFEHLIEINSLVPAVEMAVPAFTREQLWRGLMVRVRAPDRFPNGPASCLCTSQGEGVVARVLIFGPHIFHDVVTITPQQRLQFTPEPLGDTTPIGLTITIEEPVAGQLVLRFVYDPLGEPSPDEATLAGYRHSAWLHNDRDMVQTLREWLDVGELGAASH
jgi:hypothetical protein